MLLRRRKPRTPKVDGKTLATYCQMAGMLVCGHEMPVMKSSGREVKTTRSITFSRYLTRAERAIPKKMTARRKGVSRATSSGPPAMVVKRKKWGTQRVR